MKAQTVVVTITGGLESPGKGAAFDYLFNELEAHHIKANLTEVETPHSVAVAAADLLEALKIWMRFFDEMPKGQFGKLVFDVGLMNDGFIKSRRAIAKAEGA